ncbi:hemolysin III family protein [Paenirhodobacter sp. CAU 1674]|uniref:PAQR family membrane homeostasis protein TrhA n=1 Tax=Paenirhodobacter sp. CAU 1674 TaxID=3032596 RepID=UPI0023DB4626|nr:hemolysin III family protein [Paenirhodobacter sp. CAU 1674]MDF2142778.1 hemolysin III family protein [Paenirhodobacter sp. CAU 1674]
MTRYHLPHSFKEHFADGVMHVLGVIAAVAGVTALMVWAALTARGGQIWPLVVYAVGLLASFGFSAGYNMTLHAPTRAVLRRFDHAAIYLLIAGTYTPMALLGLGGITGLWLTGAIWALALLGMVMKLGFFHRFERAGFWLYLAMGWLGVIAIWPLVQGLPLAVLVLLGTGGAIYTLGTVFYSLKSLPFSRAIWHGHVIAAAATHYAAVVMIAGLN